MRRAAPPWVRAFKSVADIQASPGGSALGLFGWPCLLLRCRRIKKRQEYLPPVLQRADHPVDLEGVGVVVDLHSFVAVAALDEVSRCPLPTSLLVIYPKG